MKKNIIGGIVLILFVAALFFLLVETPPSASNKANHRSGHVLACVRLSCSNNSDNCNPELIKACTDSAFNIYHDPTWATETAIQGIPNAIQNPVEPPTATEHLLPPQ